MRDRRVWTRLTAGGFADADARAAAAGLAVGAWVALVAEDAALDRPALSGEVLTELGESASRVVLVGRTVNALAAGEHLGREVSVAQLVAAMGRVGAVTGSAVTVLEQVREVYATPAAPVQPGSGAGRRRRERSAGGASVRGRKVLAQVSDAEFAVLAGAADAAGLAVGAWLGAVVEDPDGHRPALTGHQYAAVARVRRALRRVGTLLGQIQAARESRGRWGWPRWLRPGLRWMPRSGSRWTWRT